MSEDDEERFQQHEAIMAGLARMLDAQHVMNERVTVAIERLEVTQARIETLLARMLRTEDNGR